MDLAQLGRETAQRLRPDGRCSGKRAARELRRWLDEIEQTRKLLGKLTWDRLPSGVEWLLDNAYFAKREGKLAEDALRRAKKVRTVRGESYLTALAAPFAQCGESITAETLEAYLSGLEQGGQLTEEELGLFVPALIAALCRRLSELCGELERDHRSPAAAEGMERLFCGLRTLGTANLGPVLERVSPVEQTLRKDPAQVYGAMSEESRAEYRRRVTLLAKKNRLTERETAQKVLELAQAAEGEQRHVGWFLFRQPLGRDARVSSGVLYVACILLPTFLLALWLGFVLDSTVLVLLLLLPISDLVKNLVDFAVMRTVPARPIHRMALKNGLPAEGRTLCVIAGLLTGEDSGREYAALLERYRIANRDSGEELRFGLLADLPDRTVPMGKEQREWVSQAALAINELNQKYGGGFYLFFRRPSFHRRDERYSGWERKRGALLELVRLLKGRAAGMEILSGEKRVLAGTRYVLTLDSDTSLNVGAAREMVGAMLHPLNRPVVDKKRRVVIRGYGLLQPRIGVDLEAANRSHFSQVFAGQGGIEPYGGACSDVYHDLFDRGTYTGKGIFDVDAFFTCLDGRFPQDQVLSHDLLEGAYLRAGLLGDVELTDGYPCKVTAYFDRLHRWVRGDWQLLPWLGHRVRDEAGEWERNPISSVDKWKIFDNLRRSLCPVAELTSLLLGMCLSAPAFAAAASAAVISIWSKLLITGADVLFHGGVGIRRRYHAAIIAGVGGMALQTLIQLLFLPYHAWICISAVCLALWRSLVSRRKMLEWATAAAAERKKNTLFTNYRAQWAALAAGGFAIVFSRLPAGAAVGLIWLASPCFAWALSRPAGKQGKAAEEDSPFLLHQASLIWGYFQDWLRPEDHWLPPDNVQEKPWLGPARRTSPTNIGMALLSCAAAVDLDLTKQSTAAELIGHILSTVERLPKWRGHLYNWYDTSDLSALSPRYVSTVDSGNLRGCLIAVGEVLAEWGEEDLSARAKALADDMDLRPLYDGDRKLFSIGYDVEKEALTQSWYDLMASEARLTSYIAVAKGEVEPRHWRRLSRAMLGKNNYCGMASWTGTMFEYFMPNLLLPCEEGSLMYESLSFCVYAQKLRGGKTGTPWGISESGFYAFDPGMAYQYKAHGVQALGLKRGLNNELVIAPYASYLALLLAPRSAGRNLRRLRDMGLEGKYGLYEAADFTPGRVPAGERYAAVRSYMVHHLGMSLIAVDNTLKQGVMQRRFMRDSAMGAFRELLQEKVPVGAPVMRPDVQPGADRAVPERYSRWERAGRGYDLARPACQLLSNGLITALGTDSGAVRIVDDRGETPFLVAFRERYAPSGVMFFYRCPGGKLYPLTGAPFYSAEILEEYAWSFSDEAMVWAVKENNFAAEIRMTLPKDERGALWTVQVKGADAGELICYLEPVLGRERDHEAHPAYSKLSLEGRMRGNGVTFIRRPREGTRTPALFVQWNWEDAGCELDREKALGRGGLRALPERLKEPLAENTGTVTDPCLLVRFSLENRRSEELMLAVVFEDGEEQAERTAAELLKKRKPGSGWSGSVRRALQLSDGEGQRAMELLSGLMFPVRRDRTAPQSELWAFGVSGDLPIAVVLPPAEGALYDGVPLRAHAYLSRCGFHFDLVFLLSDGGDYRRPQRSGLLELGKSVGIEGELGRRGGIFFAEYPTDGCLDLWKDWAAVIMDANGHWETAGQPPVQPPERPICPQKGGVKWRYGEGNEVILELSPALPEVGWSQLLVNPRFGWLTDETGCGHLWQGNSREGQLTCWNNDALATGGPEWFFLQCGGEEHSLFADGDGLETRVTYGFGWARWEKRWPGGTVRTTAIVPWDGARRLLLVETPAAGELRHIVLEKGEMRYPVEGALCLGTDRNGTRENKGADFAQLLKSTAERWKTMVRPLAVDTPDEGLNGYLNGWCLYQIIACRLLGRCSRYQNGGAYGFRDQLQDTMALLPFDPAWTREQIIRCCEHQFVEGDVLHWWHETEAEADRGVRTRISDDLLWLPFALSEYIETWDDWDFLSVQVKYLTGEQLTEREKERYFFPDCASETDDVYTHALRAILCVLERGVGEHGLLKIGTGDWNDGMNRVGEKGHGESVWLTWFAVVVLDGFAPLAAHRGDEDAEKLLSQWSGKLREAARSAWDGEWFLRGWYDDGTPLGSASSEACRLDSIAQSWAVLAGERDARAETALRAALDRLYDRENNVVRLFWPPFDRGEEEPGYIKGYLPGVRENGGQYTHGAVWLALACFRLGWSEDGYALLRALLPVSHGQEAYKAEPYVLAGDVYSCPGQEGRGGWSWYTGAAGWYCQAALEGLFGLTVRGGRLHVAPAIPADWPGWSAQWTAPGGKLCITAKRGEEDRVTLDGREYAPLSLTELTGEHRLKITKGTRGKISCQRMTNEPE